MTTSAPRFAYLKDPKNPHRVMTVAYRWEDDCTTIRYGTATNLCVDEKVLDAASDSTFRYTQLARPVDTFNKEQGRKLALGRMETARSSKTIGDLPRGTKSLETIIKSELDGLPREASRVKRILTAGLERFADDSHRGYRAGGPLRSA